MSGSRRRVRAVAPLLASLTLLAVLLGAAPASAAGPPGDGASIVAEEQVGPHLSVGDGTAGPFDPPGVVDELEAELSAQNHLVAARMERVGVPLTTDFYGPGTHTWPYWERELHRSLPMLLRALRG
jgi:S-formylglutathione hydrolase FrmB